MECLLVCLINILLICCDELNYRRSRNDLIMRMQLEIVEALCGFQKVIRTLDGRDLLVHQLPGNVTKHGDLKCILNEGMPIYKDPFTHGRLIIQFIVNFPKSIEQSLVPSLEKCLPPREEVIVPDGAEECLLTDLDPEQEQRRRDTRQAYEEDEGGPSRVQCATH